MNAHFHKKFKKNYKKRILLNPSLDKRFGERFNLFLKDSSDPILKDHSLSGKLKGLRAFWVTGNIRVVYFIKDETAYFVNIALYSP